MATAKDLLHGREFGKVHSIGPGATIQEALDELSKNNIGALLVVEQDGKVKGILSERDIVRKASLDGRSIHETSVSKIMTEKVLYVDADQTVEECMALMDEKGIRHLPVYEKGKLLGLISIRDVLRKVITEQQVFIKHLEQYIMGG